MNEETQIDRGPKITVGEPPFKHDPNHPDLLALLERAKKNGSGISLLEREYERAKATNRTVVILDYEL